MVTALWSLVAPSSRAEAILIDSKERRRLFAVWPL